MSSVYQYISRYLNKENIQHGQPKTVRKDRIKQEHRWKRRPHVWAELYMLCKSNKCPNFRIWTIKLNYYTKRCYDKHHLSCYLMDSSTFRISVKSSREHCIQVKCDPLIVDPSGKHQCILTGLEKCSAVKHLLNNNGSKAVNDNERVILQFLHTSGSRLWTCSMIMIITFTYKGWIVEGFIVAALNRGDCCNAKYIWTINLFVGTIANVIVDLIRIVDSHLLVLILYYSMVILLFKIILLIITSYEVGILM